MVATLNAQLSTPNLFCPSSCNSRNSRNNCRYAFGGRLRACSSFARWIRLRQWPRSRAGCCAHNASSAAGSASNWSRWRSRLCSSAVSLADVPSQRASCSRMGSGSMSRIKRPMYCICLRRASHLVIPRAAATASCRVSGKSICASLDASSCTSASPRSCSACMACLRLVFDSGASSSVAALSGGGVNLCTVKSQDDGVCYDNQLSGVTLMADRFTTSPTDLASMAQRALALARAGGGTAAEVDVSQGIGQNVTVRKGEIETIEYNRDNGLSLTVYIDQRRGHASTSDCSDDAIAATVEKALTIARYTASDPPAGVAA